MKHRILARTVITYTGQSILSGALGWIALMIAFEGLYRGQFYLEQWKRKC